jgi:hypothetical protein
MSRTRPIVKHKGVIEIAPSIALEQRHGGRLSIWMLRTTSPSSLNVWFEHLTQMGTNLRKDKPTFMMVDVATSSITVTPYMRKKMVQLGQRVGENMAGRTAYVLQRSTLSMVLRLFVMFDAAEAFPNMEFEIFYDHKVALAWLEAGLQAAKNPETPDVPAQPPLSNNPTTEG